MIATNRAERRRFVKEARKQGYSRGAAEAYLAVKEMSDISEAIPPMFEDGDKVTVNVEQVKKRKDYDEKSEAYKETIEEVADKVFEVKRVKGNLYSLEGLDGWIFWGGDLIRLNERDGGD